MRVTKAKGVAFGTGILILGAVSLFAMLQQDGSATPGPGTVSEPGVGEGVRETTPPSPQVQDSVVMAGRAVYGEQSCAVCHSIAGEGSPRSPLDGVGSRLSPEEIRLWIVDPQSMRPGVPKPSFDELPEDDVDALVAYLQTLTG